MDGRGASKTVKGPCNPTHVVVHVEAKVPRRVDGHACGKELSVALLGKLRVDLAVNVLRHQKCDVHAGRVQVQDGIAEARVRDLWVGRRMGVENGCGEWMRRNSEP